MNTEIVIGSTEEHYKGTHMERPEQKSREEHVELFREKQEEQYHN